MENSNLENILNELLYTAEELELIQECDDVTNNDSDFELLKELISPEIIENLELS